MWSPWHRMSHLHGASEKVQNVPRNLGGSCKASYAPLEVLECHLHGIVLVEQVTNQPCCKWKGIRLHLLMGEMARICNHHLPRTSENGRNFFPVEVGDLHKHPLTSLAPSPASGRRLESCEADLEHILPSPLRDSGLLQTHLETWRPRALPVATFL